MLLERFRRPRWRHTDPDVRRQAVLGLSWENAPEREILERLVRDDPAAGVRAAAVRRTGDLALLREVLEGDTDANVRESARARYRQRLANGSGDSDLAARRQELARCADSQVLAHVARSGREEALRAAALEQVGDAGVLAESALNDPVSRLRQRAVECLDDPELLEQVATRARGHDSRVARLARDRHARIARRLDEREQACAEARRIMASLEELTLGGGHRAVLPAALRRLEARRRALTALPEDLALELDRRLAAAGESLADSGASNPATATGEAAAEQLGTSLSALESGRIGLAEGIEALERVLAANSASAERRFARAQLWCESGRRLLQWEAALREAAAAGDHARLREAIDAVVWPDSLPAPTCLMEAEAALAALERGEAVASVSVHRESAPEPAASEAGAPAAADDRVDEGAAQARQRLLDALEQVERDLTEGRFRVARRAVARLRREAGRRRGGLPNDAQRRLARAAARIAEWRDWRRFAVEPKQAQLCEAMEALAAETPESPPDRLARVRALKAEWKATGGSDSPASRALWHRFRAAAENAFAPCREWLERAAEQRQANAALRRQVNRELNGFLAEMVPERLATDELVRIRATARADWQSAQPTDDQALKGVEREFEAAMDRLTGLIQQRRKAARSSREAIVESLEALVEEPDISAAVTEAKRLQGNWKAGERAHPKVERALWKRLRTASDAVFERRDRQRREDRGREQAGLDAFEALCAELEAAAADESPEPDALRARLDAASRRFGELSGGDSSRGRAIRRRYDRAVRAVRQRIEQADRQGWEALLDRLRGELEQRFGAEPADAQADAPEWPSALPEDIRVALDARWAAWCDGRAHAPLDADRAREIVVRLEILAGLASPAGDQALRLAQQVDRLASGIGTGRREAPVAEAWRLAAEWLAVPAADRPLEERFWAALGALMTR